MTQHAEHVLNGALSEQDCLLCAPRDAPLQTEAICVSQLRAVSLPPGVHFSVVSISQGAGTRGEAHGMHSCPGRCRAPRLRATCSVSTALVQGVTS